MKRGLLILSLVLWLAARAWAVEIHPPHPWPGAPVLLKLPPQTTQVRFLGHVFYPFSFKGQTLVLLAVPLGAKPGRYNAFIHGPKPQRIPIRIFPKRYPEEHLKVPPKMVKYPPPLLARIKREIRLIKATVALSQPKVYLDGPFVWPVAGRLSSPFGLRRVYNGKPRSPHSGLDIACPEGTPVKATNRGKVALIGDFYLPGKIVILDHGLGIYTVYAHLSKILVKKGQWLEKGEVLALSGKTGRVTGPHLHFGCYIQGVKVDPQILLKIF